LDEAFLGKNSPGLTVPGVVFVRAMLVVWVCVRSADEAANVITFGFKSFVFILDSNVLAAVASLSKGLWGSAID
jgi:hypothetical protein